MKIKIALACCILINYSIVHAMECVPLISSHKHNHLLINTIQDIPKLSLANIKPCFNALPDAKRDQLYTSNNKQLSRSLTFNITLLPQELIYTIVTHMLDGDEKSAELFYNAPLWYAYKRYDEAQKMIQKSSLIKQPIALLFRLPVKQQKEIMALVTRSFASQLIDSRLTIDENDHLKVKLYENEIQENFFAGEDIGVMPLVTPITSKRFVVPLYAAGVSVGMVCGIITYIAIAVSGGDLYLPFPAYLLIPGLGGGIASAVGGHICYINAAKQRAPKIDI